VKQRGRARKHKPCLTKRNAFTKSITHELTSGCVTSADPIRLIVDMAVMKLEKKIEEEAQHGKVRVLVRDGKKVDNA
jgi:hypothetical protein